MDKRIKNRKVIKTCRLDYCEYCGAPAIAEPHHIISRGAGGPDIKENLIQLSCRNAHHQKAHSGEIPKEVLFSIIARREGKTVEQIKEIINQERRRNYG